MTPRPHHRLYRRSTARRARERGLTLIEILVTLAISVFLLGGLFTIVQNTLRVSGTQSSLSNLQDNQRLAMTMIADVIQQAGYFPDPTAYVSTTVLPSVATAPTWFAGQAVRGTHQTAAPQDSVTARYYTLANDGVINCTGGTNTTGPLLYVNNFSIDAAGNLVCTLNGVTSTLVAGLQDMQIRYGVNTSAISNGPVDTYIRADQMTTANWNNVLSVRVTLLFVNPLYNASRNDGQPQTVQFTRVIALMNRTGVNT